MGRLGSGGKLLAALFQAITPRTAGFSTLNIGAMRLGTLFLLIMLMFIGASPSSTGGGIKTTTFGVLLATVIATIRGYDEVEIGKRRFQSTPPYEGRRQTRALPGLPRRVSIHAPVRGATVGPSGPVLSRP